MKRCSKCGKEKPLSEFTKSDTGSYCLKCKAEYARKWRAANPEKARESVRKQRAANPEKERERKRKWRSANPEKDRERKRKWAAANLDSARKWAAANLEKVRELKRKWKVTNPEKVRESVRNRDARKRGNGGRITTTEWLWLKSFYNFTCLRCGRREPEIKLTIDHVVPLKLGGRNDIKNAQPLCGSCNSKKHTEHIDYRPVMKLI